MVVGCGAASGIGHRALVPLLSALLGLGSSACAPEGDGASAGYKVKIFLAYWNGPSGTTFGVAWDSW